MDVTAKSITRSAPAVRPLCSAAMLLASASAATAQAPPAGQWPAKVRATYEITYAGLKVGGFEFTSTTDGQGYTLEGHGKVSVLMGAMRWTGGASAAGRLARLDPRPQQFSFQLKGTTKSGTTKITFEGDKVGASEVTPTPKTKEDRIAVEPRHLVNVLDPMAAVMAITKAGPDPCSRRVPIYDGSTRFDLALAPARQVVHAAMGPGGGRPAGLVCNVRPELVAGHSPGQAEKYMAADKAIEMVLRPVAAAGGVYVPVEFVAPSKLGVVRVVATEVRLTPHGGADVVVRP